MKNKITKKSKTRSKQKRKSILTYSSLNMFRNCRKMYEYRYIKQLSPIKKDQAMAFGSVIHECLEIWHSPVVWSHPEYEKVSIPVNYGTESMLAVERHLNKSYPDRDIDESQKKDWVLASIMMNGYMNRYRESDSNNWNIVALEHEFKGNIVNPVTGRNSRKYEMAGKVDGIVEIDDEYFLLEHKTASTLDGGYLEKLWSDMQIMLYSMYLEQALNIEIVGVVYNVLLKAKLKQGEGESEEEYSERCKKLIAKSKTGKTSAKRKIAETDEDFQERLRVKYADTSMFHRETIYFKPEDFELLRDELWELTHNIVESQRRGIFYRNTSYCFHYNRACRYFPICSSGESTIVMDNLFETSKPHQELEVGK